MLIYLPDPEGPRKLKFLINVLLGFVIDRPVKPNITIEKTDPNYYVILVDGIRALDKNLERLTGIRYEDFENQLKYIENVKFEDIERVVQRALQRD